jgi:hypothetical protein
VRTRGTLSYLGVACETGCAALDSEIRDAGLGIECCRKASAEVARYWSLSIAVGAASGVLVLVLELLEVFERSVCLA